MLTKKLLTGALNSFLLDEAHKADPRVGLLQEFMGQEAVSALPETDLISWSKFISFVKSKAPEDLFESLSSTTKVDKLFLDFKGVGHFDSMNGDFARITADFLDSSDLFGRVLPLSRASQTLFAALAESARKDKFLELGINPEVVDQLFTTHRVKDPSKLYQKLKQLFRRPHFDMDSYFTIRGDISESIEALIIFSGEVETLRKILPNLQAFIAGRVEFSRDSRRRWGVSFLKIAVWSGSVPMLDAICEKLDFLNFDVRKALTAAIKSGSVEMFEACRLKLGGRAPRWAANIICEPTFFDAADAGSADMLLVLADGGYTRFGYTGEKETFPCRVARSGSLPAMKLISEVWGMKPSSDEVVKEMLAQAALSGNKEMAIFALNQLLRVMPKVPSPLYCEEDFAYFAARSGSVEMMRLVSRDGAGIEPHVLGAAVRSGSVAAVEFACKEWGLVPSSRAEYIDLGLQYSDGVSLRVVDRPVSLQTLAQQSRNPRMLEIVNSLLLAGDHHPEPPQAAGVAAGPRA